MLFFALHYGAELPAAVAAIVAWWASRTIFAPVRRGTKQLHPDPFAGPIDEESFKRKYRFYPDDVKRLARALGLPATVVAGSRHTMPRDRAVLVLLAKCVPASLDSSYARAGAPAALIMIVVLLIPVQVRQGQGSG